MSNNTRTVEQGQPSPHSVRFWQIKLSDGASVSWFKAAGPEEALVQLATESGHDSLIDFLDSRKAYVEEVNSLGSHSPIGVGWQTFYPWA